jgi:hypothetical protein
MQQLRAVTGDDKIHAGRYTFSEFKLKGIVTVLFCPLKRQISIISEREIHLGAASRIDAYGYHSESDNEDDDDDDDDSRIDRAKPSFELSEPLHGV